MPGTGPKDRQSVPAHRAQADPDLADLRAGEARRDAQGLRQHLCDAGRGGVRAKA